jgi:hypothetical protein
VFGGRHADVPITAAMGEPPAASDNGGAKWAYVLTSRKRKKFAVGPLCVAFLLITRVNF